MVGEHRAAWQRARRCAAVGPDMAEGRRMRCWHGPTTDSNVSGTKWGHNRQQRPPAQRQRRRCIQSLRVTRWELTVPKRTFSPMHLSCDTSGVVRPRGKEKPVAQLVWRLLDALVFTEVLLSSASWPKAVYYGWRQGHRIFGNWDKLPEKARRKRKAPVQGRYL